MKLLFENWKRYLSEASDDQVIDVFDGNPVAKQGDDLRRAILLAIKGKDGEENIQGSLLKLVLDFDVEYGEIARIIYVMRDKFAFDDERDENRARLLGSEASREASYEDGDF